MKTQRQATLNSKMGMKFTIVNILTLCTVFISAGIGVTQAAELQPPLQQALAEISSSRMQADITSLSGPEFNGRQTGTLGDEQSGSFVIDRMKQLGLQPTQSTSSQNPWILSHDITVSKIEPQPVMRVDSTPILHPKLGTDYLPVLDSPPVNVTAPVVFVGYGISDPARNFDEYEHLDVRNRIVLFLRGKPESFPKRVSHAEKERTAREKGAVAFLTVTGPILSGYEKRRGISTTPLAYYGQIETHNERPIPGAWISPHIAETILKGEPTDNSKELPTIQEQLNAKRESQSRHAPAVVHIMWRTTQVPGTLVNVIGQIPGKGTLAKEMVVLGAHRDHFGEQAGLVFPGADDNASGTAVLLEVARAIMKAETTARRTIIFASFSGEEAGMLGSKLYVAQPPIPLKQTVAMVNVDHVGVGNGNLTVGVTHQPKSVAQEAGALAGLKDKLKVYGYFPGGDHVPFHKAGIPTVTVVSAGSHPHFHQSTDQADTINPDILKRSAQYVLAVTWHLATKP